LEAAIHAESVNDVIHAVDFTQLNGVVSDWTVGHSEWQGTEVQTVGSDISASSPPA